MIMMLPTDTAESLVQPKALRRFQAPIDEEPDRQRVNYGYGGGFGGGHGPGIDAAEDEHGMMSAGSAFQPRTAICLRFSVLESWGMSLRSKRRLSTKLMPQKMMMVTMPGPTVDRKQGEHVGARHPAEDDHGVLGGMSTRGWENR